MSEEGSGGTTTPAVEKDLLTLGVLAGGIFVGLSIASPEILELLIGAPQDRAVYAKSWHLWSLAWTALTLVMIPIVMRDRLSGSWRLVFILSQFAFLVLLGLSATTLFVRQITDRVIIPPLTSERLALAVLVMFPLVEAVFVLFHKTRTIRVSFAAIMLGVDLPFGLAAITLLVQSYVREVNQAEDAFLFGAVALQLVVNNALFILLRTGLSDNILRRIASAASPSSAASP